MAVTARLDVILKVVLLCINCYNVDSVSQQAVSKTLYDFLMTDYDSSLIPICSTGSNVSLNMDLALRQVMDVNEREQILTTNIWLRLTWNDCRLEWTPSTYNNITYIMLKYHDIWIPDITLYDSAAEEVMFPGVDTFPAYISSSGSVTYNFPTVSKSICRVNVRYFPFDTQECSLKFGSWSHHGLELDLISRNPTGDLDSYIENSEWTVDRLPAERHVLYYNCCPEPYPDVTFYIVMTRLPAFYLLTMIFPCILTSFVAALGFILPAESGEKVSLEITVLLSLAVFLLVVSESLPPASDNFPIIGSYFASSMVLVSLSLVQCVVVLNIFYRGTNGRKVPRLLRIIGFQYLGKFLCMSSSKVDVITDSEEMTNEKQSPGLGSTTIDAFETTSELSTNFKESSNLETHVPDSSSVAKPVKRNGLINVPGFVYKDPLAEMIKEQTRYVETIAAQVLHKQNEEQVNSEWRDLANILDRVFLILYLLITVITTLSFILPCL